MFLYVYSYLVYNSSRFNGIYPQTISIHLFTSPVTFSSEVRSLHSHTNIPMWLWWGFDHTYHNVEQVVSVENGMLSQHDLERGCCVANEALKHLYHYV